MSDKYLISKNTLVDIAGAIRDKTSASGSITVKDFSTAIRAIDTAENLDAEIQEQKEKIAELETILANKASGDNNAPITTRDITVTVWDDGNMQIDETKTVNCTYIGLDEAGQMQQKNITLEVDDTVILQCVIYTWITVSSNEIPNGVWGETYYPQVTLDAETFRVNDSADMAALLLDDNTNPWNLDIYVN